MKQRLLAEKTTRLKLALLVGMVLMALEGSDAKERSPGVSRTPTALEVKDRAQGRSMVISRGGIVATEHPLASQAGAMILARGGSAVDAAVAANAVMGLVAPMSNGIGGDLFAIVFDHSSGKLLGLNASGWAPSGLTAELLRRNGHTTMPQRGIHAVTVPGAVAGWDQLLARFGRIKREEVLAPAIHYAREGFPVTEWVSALWFANRAFIEDDKNAVGTYLPDGHPLGVGEVFRNPDLASSYAEIAAHGAEVFYKGELARRIVECSQRHGGTMSLADLSEYKPEWVEPISTEYRGWRVFELPPNGQGVAALGMLNLMEGFPLADFGHNSARALHVMIEAKKLAYADLLRYVADPRFAKVPAEGILSKSYASERRKAIDPSHANCQALPGKPPETGSDTIYLSVVDREGNMVSLIQSNYDAFGSGLVPDRSGFVLHNRGGLFSLEASHPNVLAGRKRPLHTIIPAFMSRGDVRIAFGIMGGWNQSQAHAQFVSNVVDHGLNIQAALESPRFTKITFEGCDVQLEDRIPKAVRDALHGMGHEIVARGHYSSRMGGGQAVLRDFSGGINYGASDPRKDGAAVPEPQKP